MSYKKLLALGAFLAFLDVARSCIKQEAATIDDDAMERLHKAMLVFGDELVELFPCLAVPVPQNVVLDATDMLAAEVEELILRASGGDT